MIILVRHGEATHHTEHLTGGWTDSALTKRGLEQMTILAGKLAKTFTGRTKPAIFSSDLQRAAVAAKIIAGKISGVEAVGKRFLREKNNGKAAGLTEEAAKAFYCRQSNATELDNPNYVGGETRRGFYNRCRDGFNTLLAANEDIIIVAHKGTIQNILYTWLQLSIDEVCTKNISFDIRPASVTILGINKWQEHAVFTLNDTSYLTSNQDLNVFKYKIRRRL